MNYTKAVILGGIGYIIVALSIHANVISKNECSLIDVFIDTNGSIAKNLLTKNYDQLHPNAEELFPSDAIVLAMQNMQAACCQAGELNANQCPSSSLMKEFAPSTMIFQQIVNIGMRRMDGYAEGIYGKEDLIDPLAKKRRTYLEERGTNPNGTPPGMILGEFYQLVSLQKADKDIMMANPVYGPLVSDIECSNLRIYESLIGRMQQQCALAYCLTNNIYDLAKGIGKSNVSQGLQTMYGACLTKQQQRIIREYDTTTNIMQMQANVLSQRAQEEYLQTYFVNTRMSTLAEKITKMVGLLEIINTKYTEGTKMCN